MKLSEIITRLERMRAKYGDREVYLNTDAGTFGTDNVLPEWISYTGENEQGLTVISIDDRDEGSWAGKVISIKGNLNPDYDAEDLIDTIEEKHPRMILREMLDSIDYQNWKSDRLGNDLFIDDPERASRLQKYAEEGLDGSTHGEVLRDWRDYISDSRFPDSQKEDLLEEIDAIEDQHIRNGSINNIIDD